jgi:hypothetical protein
MDGEIAAGRGMMKQCQEATGGLELGEQLRMDGSSKSNPLGPCWRRKLPRSSPGRFLSEAEREGKCQKEKQTRWKIEISRNTGSHWGELRIKRRSRVCETQWGSTTDNRWPVTTALNPATCVDKVQSNPGLCVSA